MKSEDFFGPSYFLFFILIIVFIIASNPVFKMIGSVTEYSRECSKEDFTASDCTSWSGTKQKFFVNGFTQQIFESGPLFGHVIAFTGCSIENTENWSCNNGGITDNDGFISSKDPVGSEYSEQFISPVKYFMYKYFWNGRSTYQ